MLGVAGHAGNVLAGHAVMTSDVMFCDSCAVTWGADADA